MKYFFVCVFCIFLSVSYTSFSQKSYKHLDEYAKNTPKEKERTLDGLTEYLIQPADKDIEKVRVIFSWIAFHIKYDTKGYFSGSYGDPSANGVMRSRKSVCEGYATLFQTLLQKAGIESEKISGYAKGYGYSPRERFSRSNHAWNAAKIDGTWKLFDVTWGAGFINNNAQFVFHFNDYYFDTPPIEFLFEHLPEDDKWQLHNPSITLKQYENMPHVKSSFFKIGFDATTIFNEYIHKNEKKEYVFVWDFPEHIKILSAPYIKKLSKEKTYNFVIQSNDSYDIQAVTNKKWTPFQKNGTTFSLSLNPQRGNLKIYAKKQQQDTNYDAIIEYIVQ
ncbi:MAG: transglutaminase domain-containing protein [Chitinophagaceae bacterium]|nr:transglutaminase domain-containing protein [Chitinophagaceae bacterium]